LRIGTVGVTISTASLSKATKINNSKDFLTKRGNFNSQRQISGKKAKYLSVKNYDSSSVYSNVFIDNIHIFPLSPSFSHLNLSMGRMMFEII
jgi:hypothetical protein